MENGQVRTCLTVADEPVKEIREEIRCPKKIREIILSNLKENATFVPSEIENMGYDPSREETGFLHCHFRLSNLRDLCGLTENDDNLILSVLDSIVKKGQLRIGLLGTTREMHFNDIGFGGEIGTATRTLGASDVRVTVKRDYTKEPLKRKEWKHWMITDIEERVKEIRRQRDEHFRKSFGQSHPSAELEKALRREDAEDGATERQLLNEIASRLQKIIDLWESK